MPPIVYSPLAAWLASQPDVSLIERDGASGGLLVSTPTQQLSCPSDPACDALGFPAHNPDGWMRVVRTEDTTLVFGAEADQSTHWVAARIGDRPWAVSWLDDDYSQYDQIHPIEMPGRSPGLSGCRAWELGWVVVNRVQQASGAVFLLACAEEDTLHVQTADLYGSSRYGGIGEPGVSTTVLALCARWSAPDTIAFVPDIALPHPSARTLARAQRLRAAQGQYQLHPDGLRRVSRTTQQASCSP